ncbi:MAG: hypothetical protein HRT71_21330 [Flavobacteriales bacterium]|nr:hypothetical protein [Flavobacteriales bacterium]
MENHQTATKSVLNTFPDNFKLDPQTRALHLIEEAVELANSVSKKAGKLPTTLSKGELEESFGGVLFDLFTLASQLNVNLNEIYPSELERFKTYSK